MDICMIWARHSIGDAVWLVDAWDDDSIAGNGDGWEHACTKAAADNGADNIRIIKATVDLDKIDAAFEPSKTTLTIKENNA